MSLTSLLQRATYNQHTVLQGLISYMEQVTVVEYASVNNPCTFPLCCRYVPAILSVANLAPYLWPLNCCGLRPQRTMAGKGCKEGICDLSNVVAFSHNINLAKISPNGNTGYTLRNIFWQQPSRVDYWGGGRRGVLTILHTAPHQRQCSDTQLRKLPPQR